MIKKLRIHFCVIATLSMLVVFACILGGMAVINYRHLVDKADQTTRMLSDGGGEFMDIKKDAEGTPPSGKPGDEETGEKEGSSTPQSSEEPGSVTDKEGERPALLPSGNPGDGAAKEGERPVPPPSGNSGDGAAKEGERPALPPSGNPGDGAAKEGERPALPPSGNLGDGAAKEGERPVLPPSGNPGDGAAKEGERPALPPSGNPADGGEKKPEAPPDGGSNERNPESNRLGLGIFDALAGTEERLSPEMPFETRYFTVSYDASGTIVKTDVSHIAAVDEKAAKKMASAIVKGNRETGFEGIYRYRCASLANAEKATQIVIFVDCNSSLKAYYNTIRNGVLVFGAGFIAVFLLVFYFSGLVFRPVAESYQKQRQFITDASHELKTPLAIIRANTEILELHGEESKWTKSTMHQVERLSELTEQLITLSKLSEGNKQKDFEVFNLSNAVWETLDPFTALMETKHIRQQVDIADGLRYRGDEKSIRRLVDILLDNAVKYVTENGQIKISLKQKGRRLQLVIENDADNVEQGKQDILFERFYRSDKSRNSSTGGSGIGLSVAKAVAKEHKGKLSAYSRDGKSLTVELELM